MRELVLELGDEVEIVAKPQVRSLELVERRDQRFGDEHAAVRTEVTTLVGQLAALPWFSHLHCALLARTPGCAPRLSIPGAATPAHRVPRPRTTRRRPMAPPFALHGRRCRGRDRRKGSRERRCGSERRWKAAPSRTRDRCRPGDPLRGTRR